MSETVHQAALQPAAVSSAAAPAATPKAARTLRSPARKAAVNKPASAAAPARSQSIKAASPRTIQPAAQPASVVPELPKAPATRPARPDKPKIIREGFWIPKSELALIAVLKTRSLKLAQPARKSELIRAGIRALAEMKDSDFLSALKKLPIRP